MSLFRSEHVWPQIGHFQPTKAPQFPVNGDLWYDIDFNLFKGFINGSISPVGGVNNTPGIPIYNGPNEIYATSYGVKATAIRYSDCSFVNGSKTVNCGISPGNSDVPFTSSMIGWNVFGTNGPPTTPGPTATAILPVGTITAVNSATQIVVSLAATNNCTSTNGNDQCQLVIAQYNDTAALQAATNAAFTTQTGTTGGHLILPQGIMWIDKPITVSSSTGIDNNTQSNGSAVGAYVTGAGYNQTVIIPVPNVSWATMGSNIGAFFATTATRGKGWHYRDFSIDGAGQYAAINGGVLGITSAALFLNQNSSATNIGIYAWGVGSGIATTAGDAAEAVIDSCFIGGGGAVAGINAGSYTKIINSAIFWNIGTANLVVNGIHITSIHNTYDFPDAVNGIQVQVNGSATTEFYSTDDLYLSLPQNTQIGVKVTANGTAHINHARISNPLGTNCVGLSVDAGSSVYLLDTRILFNANAGQALSIAGSLFDLGGNVIQTATANSITGTLVNFPAEPSIGGRCLGASVASPEACGSSSNGKVAVPATTTTYTINTTTVVTGAGIYITPTQDNSGIAGAPTCAVVATPFAQITGIVSGTSFTFSLPSNAGISCFNWSIR